MAIGTAAAIIGGGVLGGVGSYLGGRAAQKGAQAQAEANLAAARESNALMEKMWQTGREDIMPWMKGGEQGLNALMALYGMKGDMTPEEMVARDPSYAFRFNEGQRALERSAAGKGNLFSGRTGKDLITFGQGMGSTEYGNISNRLAALAGLGQTAAGTAGGYGINAGNVMGRNTMTAGQGAGNAMWNAGQARAGMYGGFANSANKMLENWMTAKAGGLI